MHFISISAAMWALVFSAQDLGLATCRARFCACAVKGAARARFLWDRDCGCGGWVECHRGHNYGFIGMNAPTFVAFILVVLFHNMFKVPIWVAECMRCARTVQILLAGSAMTTYLLYESAAGSRSWDIMSLWLAAVGWKSISCVFISLRASLVSCLTMFEARGFTEDA